MAEDNKNFELKIITPDRTFFEGDVGMVEFKTTEGQIGVYRNHSFIPHDDDIDMDIVDWDWFDE